MPRSPSTPEPERLNTQELQRLRQAARKWYEQHARDLPWRRTGDPYRIWISEIMLQQTTVVAVVPYFERFLNRFPTVRELAAASQDEVLKSWEGLGYYSRARNIHKAAGEVMARFGGEFPCTVDELHALPGIGRYTAGAIMSFAFNLPAPIVEANTLRLYCRLMAYDDDPRSTVGQRALWSFAEQLVSRDDPGVINQALMEIGSQVCTPAAPRCDVCPLQFACRAFATSRQQEIPLVAKRPEVTPLIEYSIAVRQGERYLLRKNPEGQRWAGLWDFVRLSTIREDLLPESGLNSHHALPKLLVRDLEQAVLTACGCETRLIEFITEIKHSVTRYRIRLQCLIAEWETGTPSGEEARWLSPDEFVEVPLSVTGRKFAKLLN